MTIVYLREEKNLNKMLPKALLIVFLILIAGLGGYHIWDHFQSDNDNIQATGTIETTMIDLHAKLAGTLENFNIKAGDYLKKEQLIATISRNDLFAQKQRDELAVIKAQAYLSDLIMGPREQEIKETESNVNIARANYLRAYDDLKTCEVLVQIGAVSQREYENTQTALNICKNQLAAAEAKLSLVHAGNRPEQINAAEIEVKRSIAVLKAAEAMLDDLKIVSPLNGIVLTKNYEDGEFVQMGAAVLSIARENDLWIKVYIPTDDLPFIKLGDNVRFTVSGYYKEFMGQVEEIATKGEYTPKTIQTKKERTNVVFGVKIRVHDTEGILKPGMPADVVFERR